MKRCDKIFELLSGITDWSRSLGLDHKVTPFEQMIKLNQEYGELNVALEKKNKIGLMDGIGDTIVVATVIMSQFEHFLGKNACLTDYDHKIKVMINENPLFVVQYELASFIEQACIYYPIMKYEGTKSNKINYISQAFSRLIVAMDNFAKTKDLDLYECLNMALTTISFRSGEIKDGIFVKVVPSVSIIVPLSKLSLRWGELMKEIKEYSLTHDIKFFKIEFEDCSEIKHWDITYE